MKYFELVGRDDSYWILRNNTDEGLGGCIRFTGEDLDKLLDRACEYFESGPDSNIVKRAEEVGKLFNKKTKIEGDVINVFYDYVNGEPEDIEKTENLAQEMKWKYKGYEIELTADWNNTDDN
jgi:hypothetical protein